jgi:predicted lipoprotein with Yx(FWY)xxD motif
MLIRGRGRGLIGSAAAVIALAGCGTTAAEPGPADAPSPVSAAAAGGPAPPGASHRAAAASTATTSARAGGPGARATTTRAARPRSAASVGVRRAPGYFRYLVDGKGRTLYLFTADTPTRSACSGACAVAWPPVILRGAPVGGAGIVGGRLSIVRRAGGQRQLAYYGHPLYYYVGDRRPGQILCQNVEEYGGHWWLVKPNGQINRSSP